MTNIVVTGEEVDIPELVYIDENGKRWLIVEEYVKAATRFEGRGLLFPDGIPGRSWTWTGIMSVFGFGPNPESYLPNLHWLLGAPMEQQESTPPVVKNKGIREPLYES